jgi:hypothetical protein
MRHALKNSINKKVRILPFLFFIGLAACAQSSDEADRTATASAAIVTLDMYKSRSCECCGHWASHVRQAGFDTVNHHPADLNALKAKHNIAPQFQSCHTAISKEGYIFEGHIPARLMTQFLNNPPQGALGLAVPGMPVGSPGMEMGNRFSPYVVLLLNKDGSSEPFAQINSAEDQ